MYNITHGFDTKINVNIINHNKKFIFEENVSSN